MGDIFSLMIFIMIIGVFYGWLGSGGGNRFCFDFLVLDLIFISLVLFRFF